MRSLWVDFQPWTTFCDETAYQPWNLRYTSFVQGSCWKTLWCTCGSLTRLDLATLGESLFPHNLHHPLSLPLLFNRRKYEVIYVCTEQLKHLGLKVIPFLVKLVFCHPAWPAGSVIHLETATIEIQNLNYINIPLACHMHEQFTLPNDSDCKFSVQLHF